MCYDYKPSLTRKSIDQVDGSAADVICLLNVYK